MGSIRFICPASNLTDALIAEAHLTSYHRVPLAATVRRESERVFRVEKDVSLSGSLHAPWHASGHGLLLLSTGTLAERETPYHLPTELARGALGIFQNQMSQYRESGLKIPPRLQASIRTATSQLRSAIACGSDADDRRDRLGEAALTTALDLGRALADLYIEKALAARRRLTERFRIAIGVSLRGGEPRPVLNRIGAMANTVLVPFSWREIEAVPGHWDWSSVDAVLEWTAAQGIRCLAGPVVQLDSDHLPDHILELSHDTAGIAEAVRRFAGAALARYAGRFEAWVAASRFNLPLVPGLSTSTRVRMMERLLEEFQSATPRVAWMVGIDQPWGEYMATHGEPQGPLHWGEALVQATDDLEGILLDLNIAHHARGTLPRPPLPFLQMIDLWSGFGRPLYVRLNVPAASKPDRLARLASSDVPGRWTQRMQQEWVHRHVSLLLTKPSVHGIFWNDPLDSLPHDFPNGGLFDADNRPRAAFQKLAALRKAYVD